MLDLRKATLLALIGICVNFTLRAASTVVPTLTVDLFWARLTVTFILLGGLTQVLFFVVLRMDLAGPERRRLHQAATWAIVGTAIGIMPALEHLQELYQLYPAASLGWSQALAAVAPLLATISLFNFFVVFLQDLRSGVAGSVDERLRFATSKAVAGSAVFCLVNLAVFVNYLRNGQDLMPSSRLLGMAVLPFLLVAFLAMVYFFATFYRGLSRAHDQA